MSNLKKVFDELGSTAQMLVKVFSVVGVLAGAMWGVFEWQSAVAKEIERVEREANQKSDKIASDLQSALDALTVIAKKNQRWQHIRDFEDLEKIKKHRRLTRREYDKYCSLGRALGYFQTCPPR